MEMLTALTILVLAPGAVPPSAQQPFADDAAPAFDAEPAFAADPAFAAGPSFAGAPFQRPEEPFLQWDGATEDAYRRAIHLMDVRARYAESAEILLGLMDTDAVIQVPGQASWVGAKAAEALHQAGRSDEAEALLPGIRRGAEGTDFEEPVSAMLAHLERYRQESGKLDGAFLNYVEGYLHSTGDFRSMVFQLKDYDRQLHPYLQHIAEREQGEHLNIVLVSRVGSLGLHFADEEFTRWLEAYLRDLPVMTAAAVMSRIYISSKADEQAETARNEFFMRLCANGPEPLRGISANLLHDIAKRTGRPSVCAYLQEVLLDPEFPAHHAVLEQLQYHPQFPGQYLDLIRAAASSPVAEVASSARWTIAESPAGAELMAGLALQGSTEDKICFLAGLTAGGRFLEDGSQMKERWDRALSQYGRDPGRIVRDDLKGAEARVADAVIALLNDQNEDVRVFATHAAIVVHAWDAVRRVIASGPEPWFSEIMQIWRGWDDSLDQVMIDLVPHPEFGSWAVSQLLDRRVYLRVSPEVLFENGLGTRMTEDRWTDAARRHRNQRSWDRLHGMVRDDRIPARARVEALRYLGEFERDQARHFDVLGDIVAEADPAWIRAAWNDLGQWERSLEQKLDREQELSDSDIVHLEQYMRSMARADVLANQLVRQCHDLVRALWEAHPKKTHDLLLSLFDDDETRRLAIELMEAPRSPNVWYGRAVLHAMEQGTSFSALPTDVMALASEAPEMVRICEIMLERGEVEPVLLRMRRSPAARRALESQTSEYWNDPEYAPLMVAIYAEAPDSGQWVPKMLEVWNLQGLQTSQRASLLYRYGLTLDERVVPLLLEQLGSPEEKIAGEAERALERMREIKEQRAFWETWQATGAATSPALALLRKVDDDDLAVRVAAIRSLGTLGAKEALPRLVSLLEDENPEVRAAAAEALDRINSSAPTGTPERPQSQGNGGSSDDGSSD